jgi:hypothetical protein
MKCIEFLKDYKRERKKEERKINQLHRAFSHATFSVVGSLKVRFIVSIYNGKLKLKINLML